jgi:hypothetical protein
MALTVRVTCVVALLLVSGIAVAQQVTPDWLVGKWQGATTVGTTTGGEFEITVKSDGTYEGSTQVSRGVIVQYRDGKWKIEGESVVFQHLTVPPRAAAPSRITWTLKRDGDNLEGSGFREVDSRTFSVRANRVK